MLQSLGFGIVGTGMIAGKHAEVIAQLRDVKLIGVAGRNEDTTREFAIRRHVPFATTSVADLVARPDIHIICIASPSGAHLDSALPAIAAGKHVLVEKPIEITTARGEEMIRAGEKAGVKVAPIFQARFTAAARQLKAALDAGRFGKLVLCSAYVKWHRPATYYKGWKGTLALDGGGALMNQGSHAVDLLRWFAGPPAEVFGWTTRRVHGAIEAEDTVCASIRFASGALGAIEATTAAWPGWGRRIEICGERGSAALEDDRIARWEFKDPAPEDAEIIAGLGKPVKGSGASSASAISNEPHQRQFEDVLDSVRNNRPLKLDAREALAAVALIESVYESARKGTSVRLAQNG